MDEPLLEAEDIQGHIFPGFASLHLNVLGLKIININAVAAKLSMLLPRVTTLKKTIEKKTIRKKAFLRSGARNFDQDVLMALSFSNEGLKAFDFLSNEFSDGAFKNGMHSSAAILNDTVGSKSDPANWLFGNTPERTPDILIIFGSDDQTNLDVFKSSLIAEFETCATFIYEDKGMRFAGDKEHFGFKDAISQPAIRGKISDTEFLSTRYIAENDPNHAIYAKPGQPLIWPGQFIFGYPSQSKNPLVPNNKPNAIPAWLKNGSFLVLRRLNQDVKLFKDQFEKLSKEIKNEFGEEIRPEVLQAKAVGRWPDGTPLTASPQNPDQIISGHRFRENNFFYSNDTKPIETIHEGVKETLPQVERDSEGLKCPYFAHIRKVNPRDDSTEIGNENTFSKYILRRGINFGLPYEQDPESERGLLFMCYQTSIRNQFEFLQKNWANSSEKPSSNGHDLVIGQTGTNTPSRIATLNWNDKIINFNISGEWVFTTGGGYFITPGINAIRTLIQPKL